MKIDRFWLGYWLGFIAGIGLGVAMVMWTEKLKPVRLWVHSDGKVIVIQRLGIHPPPTIATNWIPTNGSVGFEVEVAR